jgi:hypothetical protein
MSDIAPAANEAEIEALKAEQTRIQRSSDLYAIETPEVQQKALAAYEETVTKLSALLGPDAHCAQVDNDLFSAFSDLWKDDYGSRPRHHVTVADVKEWLAKRKVREEAGELDF